MNLYLAFLQFWFDMLTSEDYSKYFLLPVNTKVCVAAGHLPSLFLLLVFLDLLPSLMIHNN
jgi:hypothetical protein